MASKTVYEDLMAGVMARPKPMAAEQSCFNNPTTLVQEGTRMSDSTSPQSGSSPSSGFKGNRIFGGSLMMAAWLVALWFITSSQTTSDNQFANTVGGKMKLQNEAETIEIAKIKAATAMFQAQAEAAAAGVPVQATAPVFPVRQSRQQPALPSTKWGDAVTPAWYKATGLNRQTVGDGFRGKIPSGSGVWFFTPGTITINSPQGIAKIDGDGYETYLPSGQKIDPKTVSQHLVSGIKVVIREYGGYVALVTQ